MIRLPRRARHRFLNHVRFCETCAAARKNHEPCIATLCRIGANLWSVLSSQPLPVRSTKGAIQQ
jgi:hypothetical protein